MTLKPAYLIHGDDHGAIAERRAGLRALAEADPGGGIGLELLGDERASPAGVAAALRAITLAIGHRVVIVEGVERWRQADCERELLPAMEQMPPQTTVALFARSIQVSLHFRMITPPADPPIDRPQHSRGHSSDREELHVKVVPRGWPKRASASYRRRQRKMPSSSDWVIHWSSTCTPWRASKRCTSAGVCR